MKTSEVVNLCFCLFYRSNLSGQRELPKGKARRKMRKGSYTCFLGAIDP